MPRRPIIRPTSLRRGCALAGWVQLLVVGILVRPAEGQSPPSPDSSLQFSGVTPAQDDETVPSPDEPIPELPSVYEPRAHSGYYFRGSGLFVDPRNDAHLLDGSGTVGTDDSGGVSLALGFSYAYSPISVEFEYAYRRIDTDNFTDPFTMLQGDSRVSLHTLSMNVLYDQPDLLGPVGIYAGAGIGVQVDHYRFSNSSMGGSTTEIDGEGFFWQFMAGVTVSIDEHWQFYTGVRWAGGEDVENDGLGIDPETTSIEFGLRWFF